VETAGAVLVGMVRTDGTVVFVPVSGAVAKHLALKATGKVQEVKPK
jgi:hypothetical protein